MAIAIDHAFIACQPGGPEANSLLQRGFVEGSSNTHAGQGTANRRFFFDNFMLELLWVVDHAEATSERTRRTRLWERCSNPETAELIYMPFLRTPNAASAEPTQHRLPFHRLRSVAIGVRTLAALSAAALATQRLGQLRYFASDRPVIELHFEGATEAHVDLRPTLPLVLSASASI